MASNILKKTIHITLALAMLLANAPQAQALRTKATKPTSVDEKILYEEVDGKPGRGADIRFITKTQNEILREVLKDLDARKAEYRRKDLEKELGLSPQEGIKIQIVPGFYEAAKAKGVPVKGHFAIEDGFAYIDKDAFEKHGIVYVAHEVSEGREIRDIESIGRYAKKEFKDLKELKNWIDNEANPVQLVVLWDGIHDRAPKLPDETKELAEDFGKDAIGDYEKKILEYYTEFSDFYAELIRGGIKNRNELFDIANRAASLRLEKDFSGDLLSLLIMSLDFIYSMVLNPYQPSRKQEIGKAIFQETIKLCDVFNIYFSPSDKELLRGRIGKIKDLNNQNVDGAFVRYDAGQLTEILENLNRPARGAADAQTPDAGEVAQGQDTLRGEVFLKNGAREPKAIVVTTMLALKNLLGTKPGAFYELVMKCRDRDHEFFGNTQSLLEESALVQSDGSIHQSIRNVVLSAVEGEGLEMTLGNPVAVEDVQRPAEAQGSHAGGAATVEESFARWDVAIEEFNSAEKSKQTELGSQLAELAENAVFTATNAGLTEFLNEVKDYAYGVIALDAGVLKNITAIPLLRLIKENMPPDGIKIAVWGVQDESTRKELSEAGVFTFTTIDELVWFNQHKQSVILITSQLQPEEKAFADSAFNGAYAYQLINIPHIEDNTGNINLLAAVLMNAISRLSLTGGATKDAFKKSLEWNLANERLNISEEARAALANIEDSLITVLPAAVRNAKMLEMIKFYATQK